MARGNSGALCVVVPDMPRLSLDGALGPREKCWMETSDGTVVVKQYRGEGKGVLLGFVLVGPRNATPNGPRYTLRNRTHTEVM